MEGLRNTMILQAEIRNPCLQNKKHSGNYPRATFKEVNIKLNIKETEETGVDSTGSGYGPVAVFVRSFESADSE
jgi:hypothetical protein